jgi:hypothetical protein
MTPNDFHLQVGKRLTNASEPSTSKRSVRELATNLVLLSVRTKPIWIIDMRVLEDARNVVVDHYGT